MSTTSLSGVLIIAFRKSWTPTTFETPSRSPTAKKRRIASHKSNIISLSTVATVQFMEASLITNN